MAIALMTVLTLMATSVSSTVIRNANGQQCLSYDPNNLYLRAEKCDPSLPRQQWTVYTYTSAAEGVPTLCMQFPNGKEYCATYTETGSQPYPFKLVNYDASAHQIVSNDLKWTFDRSSSGNTVLLHIDPTQSTPGYCATIWSDNYVRVRPCNRIRTPLTQQWINNFL
jgi:hypothetical protein